MATWDSADCLARFKRYANRPSSDESFADADCYALLTEAQREWVGVFAAMVPWAMMGAPTLMSTADSGATYTFSGSITPLAVQVFDATNGRLLRPGAYWDSQADYVWEGSKIRMPRGSTKTFAAGPYARYITQPGVIDGSTEPTLLPDYARILLIYRALIKWTEVGGGFQDPETYRTAEQRAWVGNPATGDVGILGTLKMQNPFYGAAAFSSPWPTFAVLNTVEGYTAL